MGASIPHQEHYSSNHRYVVPTLGHESDTTPVHLNRLVSG
jgi:hypothetical protein